MSVERHADATHFTMVPNEVLEALIGFPFSKRQYKVLLHVIRKTYGYRKKTDDMTVTQIANATGLTRPHASATLHELVRMGAVLKRDGKHGYVIGINKDYGSWRASQNGTRPKTGTSPSQNGNIPVPKQDTQKTTPKDNSKRKGATRLTTIDEYLQSCRDEGVKPIRPEHAVFRYAEEAGIPREFVRLCFREFVERYRDRGKKQKDWPLTFLNCVRGRWYKLWYFDQGDGTCKLTTDGVQAMNKHEEALGNA